MPACTPNLVAIVISGLHTCSFRLTWRRLIGRFKRRVHTSASRHVESRGDSNFRLAYLQPPSHRETVDREILVSRSQSRTFNQTIISYHGHGLHCSTHQRAVAKIQPTLSRAVCRSSPLRFSTEEVRGLSSPYCAGLFCCKPSSQFTLAVAWRQIVRYSSAIGATIIGFVKARERACVMLLSRIRAKPVHSRYH